MDAIALAFHRRQGHLRVNGIFAADEVVAVARDIGTKRRRACALHYVRNDVEFATPALPYDTTLKFRVS